MKKLRLLLSSCVLFLFFNQGHAQVRINVEVNIGTQPPWGATGYDRVDYYYLPEIETYYCVPQHQFIYFDGGQWVFTASLPARCRDYDLYRGYKVVINEPRPWLHNDVYRARYVQYRQCYDRQPVLRDCRDEDDDNDGPGHGHGRGHAYGRYKKHDRGDD